MSEQGVGAAGRAKFDPSRYLRQGRGRDGNDYLDEALEDHLWIGRSLQRRQHRHHDEEQRGADDCSDEVENTRTR